MNDSVEADPSNGIIESTSGVPTTAADGFNKGFFPDNTDSIPNPSFIKCAGGDMGSQAGGGYNCLIQVDQSDQQGYAFGTFMKNGTQDAFPYFRVAGKPGQRSWIAVPTINRTM